MRIFATARAATLGVSLFGAAMVGAPALAQSDLRAEYEAELRQRKDVWVVISNHFRHSYNCTSTGCVLMGPMTDKEACEEWSKQYNRFDPNDHSRCVRAENYKIQKY